MEKWLRNSAKAIIIEDGRLLLVKMRREGQEDFYILPGGGQNPGETLEEALVRECREELGADAEPLGLAFVREYLGWKYPEFNHAGLHQIEFMFRARLLSPVDLEQATELDGGEVGTEWVPLEKLPEINVYPAALKEIIRPDGEIGAPPYVGDVG